MKNQFPTIVYKCVQKFLTEFLNLNSKQWNEQVFYAQIMYRFISSNEPHG